MSNEFVVVGVGLVSYDGDTCEETGYLTDEQRTYMGKPIGSLVCNLQDGHPGKIHFDTVDNVSWMIGKDFRADGIHSSIDGSRIDGGERDKTLDKDEEQETEAHIGDTITIVIEPRARPNPGLEIVYSEEADET